MSMRSSQIVAALLVLVAGAAIGAGLYAAAGPNGTTTVRSITTVDGAQQIAATKGLTVSEIYRRAYQGVVDITVGERSSFSFGRGGGQGSTGEGSGWVYDSKGDIVTNQHVVDGSTSITVKFWNGATYKAKVVGTDASTDLAVVKVNAPSSLLHPLQLGDSDAVEVGAGVVAIGSPFGYAESVTSGIVSALHREIDSPNQYTINDSIQTDAAINHGNSGGPLLDAQGNVIGVNAQIQSNSGGNDGVGFAIPSNTVRKIVGTLVSGQSVKHAYLGVRIATATTSSSSRAGALASEVNTGQPAWNAGIRSGDVIVKIAGVDISTAEDLTRTISAHKPGDTVNVTYKRSGKTHTVRVHLGTRPTA